MVCRTTVGFRTLLLALAGFGLSAGWQHAQASDAPQPAEWTAREFIVVLEDLPRHYTCEELWYKFRDILLKLGARPDRMEVLPYRCEAEDARSPRVQLRFEILRALDPLLLPYADVKARSNTVHLEPGDPKSLEPTDCVLLEQIQNTLLRSLELESPRPLACRGPADKDFSLVTEALLPQSPVSHDAEVKAAGAG